ncbi:MAG: leucine-rich repeat protein, partial [Clostridia bacterium]|nr:leucine-rich repeat protein [Clostridia bacterium]
MEKASKATLSGTIKNADSSAIEGASVRLTDDENVPVLTTDASGAFSGEAYAGTYTARFYKDGYRSVTKEITLTDSGTNTIESVTLTPLGDMKTEKTDYGFVEDTDSEGNYQTIQFTSGPHGVAVRFQSPHIGGILKSADIFLVQNQYYSGDHILIGVIGYDDKGRLREIAPFREYDGLRANEWNTIDFSEYTIETDKPIYVAATYDKEKFSECMGVYYDTDADAKAIEKSYVYDGAFTATSTISPAGAYAVKATWLYPEDAEINPESDESAGAGGTEIPVKDDITAFVFDKSTQTITGYNGKGGAVTIPSEIDGVAVKHIGNSAFDGTGKDAERKLTSIVIPEGVETIGSDAFKTNLITSIKLPSTLTEIGARAFQYQYAENMQLDIPEGVTVIREAAFKSLASPLKITMPGVTKIEKDAFDGIRDVEVYADKLTEIVDEAFGSRYTADFPYAKVYTDIGTNLTSVKYQHLINPATVTINEINARDHEDILGKTTMYGEGNTSIGRNVDVSKFYTIGDTVTITPPDIMKSGVRYSSADTPIEMTLEKDNRVAFYYYTLAPRMRTPILDTDTEIVGFALPNADIEIAVGEDTYTTIANADGYFNKTITAPSAGAAVTVKVNGKSAASETVQTQPSGDYIIDGSVIRRYLGEGGNLTLPVSAGESGSITEIGDFAFYGS